MNIFHKSKIKYPIRLGSKNSGNYIEFLQKEKYIKLPCYFCKSENIRYLFENDRYGMKCYTSICKNCLSLQNNPRISDDAINKFYESGLYWDYYVLDNYSEKYKIKFDLIPSKQLDTNKYTKTLFFDFINSARLNYETVFEIGCAGGWNLIPFIKIDKECFGYEPSTFFVKDEVEAKIYHENFEEIKNDYDLVILKHVLEHVTDPINFLKGIRNKCKKYLYVEVPGVKNKLPSIQMAHIFYFNENELLYIFNKSGFKLIKLITVKSNNFILALLEKTEPKDLNYFNKNKLKFKFFYRLIYLKYFLRSFLKI
tara:strand:- start:3202 stop:4134 length:933 start_codon:yes stop_codon:yes gene_type:complete